MSLCKVINRIAQRFERKLPLLLKRCDRLEALGVSVERQTELIGYRDEGDRIAAGLRRSDSREETCEADYIAGCDGVHSIVRETMGADFRAAPIATFFMSPTAFSKKNEWGHDWTPIKSSENPQFCC
jgi:2-polyprenyl-6-methoxyphenol hydroxylase-like FAD-dependent oxidoreductase